MAKYVFENAASTNEVDITTSKLLSEGFPKESISLVGSESALQPLQYTGFATMEYNGVAEDESWWDRVKDFFGVGDDDAVEYETLADSYTSDMQAGNVLVVVDDDLVPEALLDEIPGRDIGYWDTTRAGDNAPAADREAATARMDTGRMSDNEDETIRLAEERMHVDKQAVQAGEVVVSKHVVEENQTINVPVMHEEVVVERRPVTGAAATTDADFGDATYSIPVWQEQVHVTKEPVVTEEVLLHTKDVTEDQQVGATLRREELDVDKKGNVILTDNEGRQPRV